MTPFLEVCELPQATASAAQMMNQLATNGEPFFFLFDFELERPRVIPLDQAAQSGIWYDFKGVTNWKGSSSHKNTTIPLIKACDGSEGAAHYRKAFDEVRRHLMRGDIYLTNLTHRVPVQCALSLEQLFEQTEAPYKVLIAGECVVFSPESFVSITKGKISTFPMKGTRLVQRDGSSEELIDDPKEIAEHATVVDLLRNDLSMVARDVSVERYRYLQQIETERGILLQTCSRISGTLSDNYQKHIGDIICSLLPAGSVSGAPKCEALRIIREAEGQKRGYYTGVCGIYDGETLESAVLIRYVEEQGNQFFFRSGGGITVNSLMEREYQEILEKVALPIRSSHDL